MTTDQPKPSEQKPSEVLRTLYLAYMDHGAKLGCTKLDGADEYVDATLAILDSHHAQLSDLAGIVRALVRTVSRGPERHDVQRLEGWLSEQAEFAGLAATHPPTSKPREGCTHDWQHHPDASGNNDAHWTCRKCGARTDRRPGGKAEAADPDISGATGSGRVITPSPTGDEAGECARKYIRVYVDQNNEKKFSLGPHDDPHRTQIFERGKYSDDEATKALAIGNLTTLLTAYAAHRTREIQEKCDRLARDVENEAAATYRANLGAQESISRAMKAETSFKAFHQRLCERFGYGHDDRDWVRDQLSLEEHIASALCAANRAWAAETASVERLSIELHREQVKCGALKIAHTNAIDLLASKDAEIKRLSDMVERLRFLLPENIK